MQLSFRTFCGVTIKEIVDTTKVDGVKEWEIEVSSFEETKRILFELGFEHKHYQENIRAIYNLNGVEITIDKWPLIPAYLEIEGQSVDAVLQTVDLLEVDKNNVTTDDVVEVYKKYGIDILSIKELKEN